MPGEWTYNGGTTYTGVGGTLDLATQAELDAHAVDTTSVHGISDTSVLATNAGVATAVSSAVAAHEADTTNVHGIANTAALATTAALAAHEADTSAVHGIADTTVLATDAEVSAAVSAHESDTTNVHGISDTSVLATDAEVASAVSAHEADTTSVHGIANTADVLLRTLADAKGDLLVATAADVLARLAVGANGRALIADSAQTAGVKWAPRIGAGHRIKTGRYYTSPAANGTGAYANGELLAIPFFLIEDATFDRIGLGVTSAGQAGSTIGIGIYADDGDGFPGARVLDAGTVPGDGATGIKQITISHALEADLYWLAAVFLNAVTTRPTVRTHQITPMFGIGDPTASQVSDNSNMVGYNVTGQSSLPANFPTGATATWNAPRVIVRGA